MIDSFDQPSEFRTPTQGAGLYWFLYSAVFYGTDQVNFKLDGVVDPIYSQIFNKSNTAYEGFDVLSRNQIMYLSASQTISVITEYPIYAENNMGSGWGGFLLDGLMSPLIVFDVYCSQTMTGIPIFDTVLYNYGNGWKSGSQSFVAPTQGYYYFSITVGVAPSPSNVWLDLLVSGSMHHCQLDMRNIHNGTEIVSRGCFLSLNAGNSVSINWRSTGTESSYGETSFRGFLYSTVSGVQAAWSVHDSGVAGGASGNLHFPNVLFTQNFTWDSAIGLGTVGVSGYYYMEIVAHTYTASQMNITITRDPPHSTPTLSRLFCTYAESTNITRSLPFLALVNEGDNIAVTYVNSQFDGNGLDGLSFQGFLLYTQNWNA